MTWKTFKIELAGHEAYVATAASRAKARVQAFHSYREQYQCEKFGSFMRRIRITICETPQNDGYDYVRRNYGVDPKVGQRVTLINEGGSSGQSGFVIYPGLSTASVHVVIDGRDFAVRVHPMNVDLGDVTP